MDLEHSERRKEIRYPMEANVVVHKSIGEPMAATAANISSSGMSLQVVQPSGFVLHEKVTVDVELEDHADRAFSAWGIASVVRIQGNCIGIRICAGVFDADE